MDPGGHPECCVPRILGKQHSASRPQGGGQLPPSSVGPACMRPHPPVRNPQSRLLLSSPRRLFGPSPPPPLIQRPLPIGPHEECLWQSFVDSPLSLSPPEGGLVALAAARGSRAGSACKRMKGKFPLAPHYSARDFSRRIPTTNAHWQHLTVIQHTDRFLVTGGSLRSHPSLLEGKDLCFASVFSLCLPAAAIHPFLDQTAIRISI